MKYLFLIFMLTGCITPCPECKCECPDKPKVEVSEPAKPESDKKEDLKPEPKPEK